MIAFGTLAVVAAALVVFVARFFRSYDCHGENADCGGESLSQLVVAYAGLIPAVGMLVASIRGRGHPWLWFLATVGVYAAWALSVAEWNS